MSRFALAMLIACLTPVSTATATETDPTFNRVTLNESAQRAVENDRLVVILFAQAEGKQAAPPADEVNRLMDWALAVANSHAGIEVQTEGYSSNPIYKDGRIRGWRVRQSLRLEGGDSRLIGDLAGQLQQKLSIQSIAYQLSEAQQRTHRATLTEAALQRFQSRAAAIADALGRDSYRIVRLNINDNHRQPAPMMRAMTAGASADASPAPARIQTGTQLMSVNVSGEIELSED